LIVVVKRGIREYFKTGLAVHLIVYPLFKQCGRDAFGMLVRVCNVTKFDDDLSGITGSKS